MADAEKPTLVTCWVDERLRDTAKQVAAAEGVSITDVLNKVIAPGLRKWHRRLVAKQHAEHGGEA